MGHSLRAKGRPNISRARFALIGSTVRQWTGMEKVMDEEYFAQKPPDKKTCLRRERSAKPHANANVATRKKLRLTTVTTLP
jgi:hypothetical protein